MPSLDLLATFLEIYRTGSLSAAAARLGVSQPAVTGQLARLEEQLGEPLFVRSSKGARPTPRAAALAARVGMHVDGLRTALVPTEESGALEGEVHLGGAAEVMSVRVLPALAPLSARGLRIRVTLGLAGDLLAALTAGRFDLVVSAVRPHQEELTVTPLVDEEFLLVGAPELAHAVDRERLAADPVAALSHLPLVAYADDLPIIRRYWRTEFGRRPPNRVAVVVPDLRAVLAAVASGMGVSVLPRYLVAPALAAGDVTQLHRPEVEPLNTLYLASRRDQPPSRAPAAVWERLARAAQEWGSL
ncbi:LysR family transcriptional regulator [Streptomyces mangrovisoli]|uniref:LysR family transcriptional regulator n=1 Tax=Streptomyces mangrovisoli TaxID=1428628 RepID=A0A1J4P0U0_9ACTN|nr:LysR family transcriptional regulator [Streptomyces mangrovisoli]OIJ68235.1 LysR family transcriptional regulator [Streptomyces mangrovisoli]